MNSGIKPKDVLSPQDRIWITYINSLIDKAVEVGKGGDKNKLYGDYQLLLAFFNGDEERAGEYFMSYCTRVSACPPDFIEFCEDTLQQAGVSLPLKPAYAMPEKMLQAAE